MEIKIDVNKILDQIGDVLKHEVVSVAFFVLGQVLLGWLIFNLMFTGIGVIGGALDVEPCKTPVTKLGKIMPGYRIGCWLTEPADE